MGGVHRTNIHLVERGLFWELRPQDLHLTEGPALLQQNKKTLRGRSTSNVRRTEHGVVAQGVRAAAEAASFLLPVRLRPGPRRLSQCVPCLLLHLPLHRLWSQNFRGVVNGFGEDHDYPLMFLPCAGPALPSSSS